MLKLIVILKIDVVDIGRMMLKSSRGKERGTKGWSKKRKRKRKRKRKERKKKKKRKRGKDVERRKNE